MSDAMPHEELMLRDEGWQYDDFSSRPTRGIRDYRRNITFARELTLDELQAVKAWLQNNDCPGWTPIYARAMGPAYRFSTTMDSSD